MAALDVKLITCRNCGLVMVKLSRDVCQTCFDEDEKLFSRVREYLRSNPNSAMDDVALALGAPVAKIQYFVNSGRLERTGVHVNHQCQTCNKILTAGLICGECAESLQKQVTELKKTISEKKDEPKGDSLWKKPSKG